MKEQLAAMTIIELVKKSHEVASQPLDYYVTPVIITELASRLEALNLVYIGAMNNLRSATSTIERMGVEGAYLLNGAAAELNGSWVRHKTVLGAQAALLCISQGDICAAREWLEGTVDEVGADMPDDMTVAGLQAWFDSQMVAVDGMSGFLTRQEAEDAIRARIPATDAFLREQMAKGVAEYASKRGFSFQHGSIHAHFGNGDVMVGSTKFENGHAGICFAPVREKEGGVGTEYKWTEGKNTEEVNAVFVISSSSAEGLEVIQGKLSDAIAQLRAGEAV